MGSGSSLLHRALLHRALLRRAGAPAHAGWLRPACRLAACAVLVGGARLPAAFAQAGPPAAAAMSTPAPDNDPWTACAAAALAAEAEAGLPPGLLLAIGKVESGRTSPVTGRLVPWPHAINVAGRGVLAPDAAAAVAEVQSAQAAGQWSVDVGCFQISLLHHPGAFETVQAGFDPLRNARYAARFLARLRAGAASWEEAAGRYHSATPGLAEPYAARVMAVWAGRDAGPVVWAGRVVQAVGVRFGMRVYTPAAAPVRGVPAPVLAPVPAEAAQAAVLQVGVFIGRPHRLPPVYRPAPVR